MKITHSKQTSSSSNIKYNLGINRYFPLGRHAYTSPSFGHVLSIFYLKCRSQRTKKWIETKQFIFFWCHPLVPRCKLARQHSHNNNFLYASWTQTKMDCLQTAMKKTSEIRRNRSSSPTRQRSSPLQQQSHQTLYTFLFAKFLSLFYLRSLFLFPQSRRSANECTSSNEIKNYRIIVVFFHNLAFQGPCWFIWYIFFSVMRCASVWCLHTNEIVWVFYFRIT